MCLTQLITKEQAKHTIESIDLSILPVQAQNELYDFYLFLQQRYVNNHTQIKTNLQEKDQALTKFIENNKKRNLKIDPGIDLTALAEVKRATYIAKQIGSRQINDCIHTAIAETHCTELITYNKRDFSKIEKLTSIKIRIL